MPLVISICCSSLTLHYLPIYTPYIQATHGNRLHRNTQSHTSCPQWMWLGHSAGLYSIAPYSVKDMSLMYLSIASIYCYSMDFREIHNWLWYSVNPPHCWAKTGETPLVPELPWKMDTLSSFWELKRTPFPRIFSAILPPFCVKTRRNQSLNLPPFSAKQGYFQKFDILFAWKQGEISY